jgi:hypothetical protein
METIKLTQEILDQGLSDNYGWSNKQLRLLCDYYGLNIKVKGWKREILGQPFPKEIIDEFLALRNVHLQPKGGYKVDRQPINPTLEEINKFKQEVRIMEAKSNYLIADPTLKKQRIQELIDRLENTLTELRQLI